VKNEAQRTIAWWLGWITLTIVTFFVAAWFWTGVIAKHYGNMQTPGAPAVWVAAVFGTWMILLVPLIIVMYNKVDKAYEDARIARETQAFEKAKASFKVRFVDVEESRRVLPGPVQKKMKLMPWTVNRRGHLVSVVLRDGRRIDNVFVLDRREVLGVYDRDDMGFDAADVADVILCDEMRLPAFRADRWLRVDGVGTLPA
jgi:hypothetical protein